MIPCDDVKVHLSEYLDEECSVSLRATIDEHLSTCSDCREELNILKRILDYAFTPKTVPALPFLWTRVRAGIDAEEIRRGIPWWAEWKWMARLTVMTAMVVGIGSGYLVYKSNTPLESMLQGRSPHQRALQVASTKWVSRDQTAMQLVLGDESWAQN